MCSGDITGFYSFDITMNLNIEQFHNTTKCQDKPKVDCKRLGDDDNNSREK